MKETFPRVVAASPEEGPNNWEKKFDGIFGTEEMQYLNYTDIMRQLVPAMRKEGITKISLFVYQGESDDSVGELVVEEYVMDGRFRTRVIDTEGNELSLFTNRVRSGLRGSRSRSLADWIRGQDLRLDQVTFCPFIYEEDGLTRKENHVDLEGPDEMVSDSDLGISSPTPVDVDEYREAVQQKIKIKAPRKPKRRKPIKSELKEKRKEQEFSNFTKVFSEVNVALARVESVNNDVELKKLVDILSTLGHYLEQHPEKRLQVVVAIKNGEENKRLKELLAFLRDDRIWSYTEHLIRKQGRALRMSGQGLSINIFERLRALAKEVHPESEHSDPDRSHDGLFFRYITNREAAKYREVLFSDLDPILFILYLKNSEGKRWLDVGSGETYKEPNSMMNRLREDWNITMVGVDPMYGERVGHMDKARGLHKLDEEWTGKNELYPYTVQRLEFEDASFDLILSCWALDKVNMANGGMEQAFRQIARVLKPGGDARLYPVPSSYIAQREGPIDKYFLVRSNITYGDFSEDQTALVVLERKKLDDHAELELKREIKEWLKEHPI